MRRKSIIFLLSVLCMAVASSCAVGSKKSEQADMAPRTAQYTLELDWSYALDPNPPKALGETPLELGSVTSAQGVVYAASQSGAVVAIDEKTARLKWKKDFEAPVTAGPIVTSKALYIGLGNGAVLSLSLGSGEEKWRYETGAAVEKSIRVSGSTLACTNVNNRVFAVNAEDGTLMWRRERPRPSEFTMFGAASPLIDNGLVYAGFSDGFLVAYAEQNGTAVWSRELAPEARFKDLDADPLRVGDVLYVASSSGGLYALSADDGHTLWQKNIYGISSIAAFQDNLYVTSQAGILRLRRSDGEIIWQNIVQKNALISELQVGKKYLYATVQRYGLVILDRKSGELLHAVDMGSDFTAAPKLTPGAIAVMSNRSAIYRFIVDDQPL